MGSTKTLLEVLYNFPSIKPKDLVVVTSKNYDKPGSFQYLFRTHSGFYCEYDPATNSRFVNRTVFLFHGPELVLYRYTMKKGGWSEWDNYREWKKDHKDSFDYIQLFNVTLADDELQTTYSMRSLIDNI